MSTSTSVDRDLVFANMASLAVHDDSSRAITDDNHTTLATTDLQPYAEDNKIVMTDIEVTDTQANDAAGATSSLLKMALPMPESSANSSVKRNPNTPDSLLQKTSSTPSADSSDKPHPGAACTTMQSTAPVPVVYPPRRANIFKTRQKNIRFPLSGLGPVTPTIQQLEAADGFSTADLEEFQAQIKNRMKQKSEMFMNMMRQNAWQQRRVEDLGEVFEIED